MLWWARKPASQIDDFRADVIAGLGLVRKSLSCRWLYDERGSALFEEITRLEEYYPTRTETAILRQNARAIADFCGEEALLFEYGAGAAIKTEILLDALTSPRLYIPIDIAADCLDQTIERLRHRYPRLKTWPVVADFTDDFDLPHDLPDGRRSAFFPGSTIGNLNETETGSFLRRLRRHMGPRGAAIIGVDFKKDLGTLIAAYDDRAGVTAEFNRNILVRINRDLGGNFPLDRFAHEARWNDAESAVEMHLVSLDACVVTVDGQAFEFRPGETIHTESSRKYDPRKFAEIAEANGWRLRRIWDDAGHRFGVFGLMAA
ncbi:MAG: L-histidine N(alpha)-methyltransferase [Xanthobacteraceae bacterium]|nr:MAG: L-histidine N(alpha)-methyltransferase [Xanthobacteraceae bacterium]